MTTPIAQELQFLHTVVDNITEGVVACNMQGQLTLFNRAMREMYGLPLEPVPADQWSTHYSVLRKDGTGPMPMEELPLFRALLGERVHDVEIILAPKDLPRRFVSVSGQPIIDEKGHQLGAVAVVRDISDDKQNRELRASEARLRSIIEATPNAMVILTQSGQLQMLNARAEQLFGYPRAQLLGQSIEMLVPGREFVFSSDAPDSHTASLKDNMMSQTEALFVLRADGIKVLIEIGLSPFNTWEGPMVLAVITDITARVAAERALKNSLHEKETLLQEIHHRVKNNLQVISSLLRLQAEHSHDEDVQRVLKESQIRLQAIALSHQLLYEHKDFSRIHLQEYITQLAKLIAMTYSTGATNVHLHFDLPPPDAYLDIHRAIPCGLIITELITNAYKHAFPHQSKGEIRISLDFNDDASVTLTISDSGVGLPSSAQLGAMGSLGFQLIPILAEQLGAQLETNSSDGTQFLLRFKPFLTREHDR